MSQDFAIADHERGGPLTWMKAEHEPTLQAFLQMLYERGLAKLTPLPTKGTLRKVTFHMSVLWKDLLDEYRQLVADSSASTPHRDLVVAAMAKLA